jgi:FtsZ-binding cell division protein ZapB
MECTVLWNLNHWPWKGIGEWTIALCALGALTISIINLINESGASDQEGKNHKNITALQSKQNTLTDEHNKLEREKNSLQKQYNELFERLEAVKVSWVSDGGVLTGQMQS